MSKESSPTWSEFASVGPGEHWMRILRVSLLLYVVLYFNDPKAICHWQIVVILIIILNKIIYSNFNNQTSAESSAVNVVVSFCSWVENRIGTSSCLVHVRHNHYKMNFIVIHIHFLFKGETFYLNQVIDPV